MSEPTATTYRLGAAAAVAVVAIGVAYLAVLGLAFARVGFAVPIADPLLAVMEVLTLLSAPALVIAMAAVCLHAAPERRVFGLVALAFTIVFAGITSTVHFVELTTSRQTGTAEIVWPSPVYAAELLAWDGFLGLALLFAAPVFAGDGAERSVRRTLWLAGALALAGTAGPLLGSMPLQRIGIAGYAVAMPIAFVMIAQRFRARIRG